MKKPVASWRYALIPAVALLYPGAWLVHSEELVGSVVAAILSVGICSCGTWMVTRVRDRPTAEVVGSSAVGWTTVIAGCLVPTLVISGWMPTMRPLRRSDLEAETWAGRLGLALAISFGLFLMFRFLMSPRRSGGRVQQHFAKRWGRGLCATCGMAVFYDPSEPCYYCGQPAEPCGGSQP